MLNKSTFFFILIAVFSLGSFSQLVFAQNEAVNTQADMPPPPSADLNSVDQVVPPEMLNDKVSQSGFFLDDNEKFIFDPTLKRDPFQIIGIKEIIKKIENKGPVEEVITDPLQKSDLSDFSVIGIMWEGVKPKAILKDKANRNHLVFTGTRIGNRNGYVALIREGQVVVMEYEDEEGRVVKKPRTLEITRSK